MKCDGYRVGGRVELTMQCHGSVCTMCSGRFLGALLLYMIQCAYLEKVKLTIFQNIISNHNYMRNNRFPCMASI